ncbi:hypothetical protein CRUP_026497 [Coryphaenoides rupestris]|nr:hypothetical protein CRUP_026497 [Coryphaenoides rupestris]
MTKVKGFGVYNNKVMDVADYVTPTQGASVFCIITKLITTENQVQGYCPECNFDLDEHTYCPIFRVGDIIRYAQQNFSELAQKGGVIGIKIGWMCDLDRAEDECGPSYSFTRLDAMSQNNPVSPGFNFRHTSSGETEESRYVSQVFALMAVCYGPVQWVRLATLRRAPAVLDQWVTLPIFAWVPVWCAYIEGGASAWRPLVAVAVQLCSVLSYGLSLGHSRGFDVALGCHIVVAVRKGVAVQRLYGDGVSLRHLLLAVVSCGGFVVLKLLDHWLAQQHSEGSVAEQVDGHQQWGDRGHVIIIAEETWPQGQE